MKKVRERLGNEKGQSMLEYILIVVFVVVVGIAVWKTFGNTIMQMVKGSTDAIVENVQDTGVLNKK